MELLIQFIFKMFDNILSTCKTISLSKGRHFLAALFAATANVFYLITVKAMTKSDSDLLIYVLSAAVFIGTYLPGIIIRKTKHDDLYIYNITADTMENGKKFADAIREHNIPIKTYKAYDSNMNKTLSCEIFCSTKEESSLVDSLMMPHFKYNISIPDKAF